MRPISALLKPPFFGVSNYFPSRIVFPARPSQSEIAHALGLVRAPSPPERSKTNDEEKVSPWPILKIVQEIQQDLKSTKEGVSSMETYWQTSCQV